MDLAAAVDDAVTAGWSPLDGVWEVRQSSAERDGLEVYVDIATTFDAALRVAAKRLGGLLPAAQPWVKTSRCVRDEWSDWSRLVELGDPGFDPAGLVPGLIGGRFWQHLSHSDLNV